MTNVFTEVILYAITFNKNKLNKKKLQGVERVILHSLKSA